MDNRNNTDQLDNKGEVIGVIDGEISAEKTRKVGLTFNEAKYLLEKYTA